MKIVIILTVFVLFNVIFVKAQGDLLGGLTGSLLGTGSSGNGTAANNGGLVGGLVNNLTGSNGLLQGLLGPNGLLHKLVPNLLGGLVQLVQDVVKALIKFLTGLSSSLSVLSLGSSAASSAAA